jgi:RNA polymerase sigma factor (sigma-70 family)
MDAVVVSDDRELLAQYAAGGDVGAFGELVKRYGGMVLGVARRVTGSVEDAEDVAQGVFLELARNCGRVAGSVPGYLHRAATTRAINARRDRATRRRHEAVVETRETGGQEEHAALIACVDAAIAELSEEFRDLLVMHYLEGRAQGEVAERLGMSQSTVSRRLESAVGELRRRLRERGMEVEGGRVMGMLGAIGPAVVAPQVMAAMMKIGLSGAGSRAAWVKGAVWVKVGAALVTAGIVGAGVMYITQGRRAVPAGAGIAVVVSAAGGAEGAATVPASAPATAPQARRGPAERTEIMGRMRDIVIAILSHGGMMPADLGATFGSVQPWHEATDQHRPRVDRRKKASLYVEPSEDASVPADATAEWVNAHTSWVYLGNADVPIRSVPNSGDTVIMHQKLDGANAQLPSIAVAFLDGHAEVVERMRALKMIDASKKTFEDLKNGAVP